MILFELTVSGFDDTVTYTVVENGISGYGFNWGSEYFEEKGYPISKSYSHQQFYNIFNDSVDHKPIIDFLIHANLVDINYKASKKIEFPYSSIKPYFDTLFYTYQKNKGPIKKFWQDVKISYSQPHRYYHTLAHLRNLMAILEAHKIQLMDWEVIQFAIFYHDIVYEVSKNDNEEQSAAWAERVMQSLNIEPKRVERCKRHILATKGHTKSDDYDTNLFTDADLSILGSDPDTYTQYCFAIRKEYSIYPANAYNEGRASVLRKFLEMPTIFKTEAFQNQYENNARINLENEIRLLVSS